jgi:pseudaminic acid cytidylyltransferase
MNFMRNLAIIPARGGSKRIPRKNIKDFLGEPIVSYSIKGALQSGLFEEVMVSTDDREIANIAVKYGAKVPFYRSNEASGDFAGTIEVIREVISEYKNQFNKEFDFICCIYPTAPLIRVQHLKSGLDLLLAENFDCVLPVVAFGYPVWRGVEITDGGKTQMIWPEYKNARSQELKKVYHDAGQWYWMNMRQIKDSIFNQNTGSLLLSEEEVQDIDNPADWKLAEMKYKLLNET